jgi:hypothetical protein
MSVITAIGRSIMTLRILTTRNTLGFMLQFLILSNKDFDFVDVILPPIKEEGTLHLRRMWETVERSKAPYITIRFGKDRIRYDFDR